MAARRKRRQTRQRAGWHTWIQLGVVFLVALALRLAYVQSIAESPGARFLQTNPERYHAWAQAILDGKSPRPPFEQPPAYAYFVATVYWLGGSSPGRVRTVQAFVDAAQCALLSVLSRSLAGSVAGWATGLLAAHYGPFLYFTGELVPATIPLFLLVAAALASRFERWVVAGVLSLAVTLFRAELLLAVAAFVAWLRFRGAKNGARIVAVTLLAGWIGATAIVSIAAGRLVPYTTGAGLNLWLGNNPYADGVDPFPPFPLQAALQRAVEQHGRDPVALDQWFARTALDFWREYPSAALQLLWKKFRWTLVDRELPNTSDIEWQRQYSWLFRLPFFPLSWGVVLCLAATGLVLSPRSREHALEPFLLTAAAATSLLVCTAFFTNARFRLPAALWLLVWAGEAVQAVSGRRHLPQRSRILAAATAVAIAGWLAFSNPYGVRSYRIAALDVNTGAAERLAGHPQKAVVYLERALAQQRDDEIAWVHLALAREQLGDLAGAATAYLEGLAAARTRDDLQQAARQFFQRHGFPPGWIDQWLAAPSAAARDALRTQVLQALRPTP